MDRQKFKVYERKYRDRDPYPHGYWLMTAEELLQRVREDSERSNYGWITSATELVHTCGHPDFPAEAAEEIRDRILTCFASIGHSGLLKGDKVAVFYCYVSSKDETVKTRFLEGMVQGAIARCFDDEVTRMVCYDAEFEREFVEKKVEEFREMDREVEAQGFEIRRGVYAKWINALSYEYDEAFHWAVRRRTNYIRRFFYPCTCG